MNEHKVCPCPTPHDGYSECSICLDKMCPMKLLNCSICSNCRYQREICEKLERDQWGRIIDPATRLPLRTCICGLIAQGGLYPCAFEFFNKSPNHRLITLPQ